MNEIVKMNKNGTDRISENFYQIRYYYLGVADVYMYLLIGEEKALLIDTGYASTMVINYVDELTDLPIKVVNTHGHPDHIGGNRYFDEVYISKNDLNTAREYSDPFFLKKINDMIIHNISLNNDIAIEEYQKDIELNNSGMNVKYLDLPEKGYFDLGNRKIYFLETPGHTFGSICLYDERSGVLISGDTLCDKAVLLTFEESTSVRRYRDSLLKLKEFCKENYINVIYPAHHDAPIGPELTDRYISLCDGIIKGEIKGIVRDGVMYADDGKICLVYKNI
ncbi:MAG: MBL fold metallo-hydrolase [Erysipelotrichaceae bacterium]|nr:MBL fold metallo-hydrolase [Erysipelotrichaceae bacterium]